MGEVGLDLPKIQSRDLFMQQVPPQELDAVWPLAVSLLRHDDADWEYMTFADIYIEVCSGSFQLWLFADQDETFACMITELRKYPRTLVMNIIQASALPSSNALDLTTFHELVERWGVEQGASVIQIPCGRKGWERVLRKFGYKFAGIVLKKKLTSMKEH